uniref:50S ribosomal protein L20 n=1 Tax=Cyanidiococcus yangmingshanensis TaxID=2690220 RepID=A0A7G5VUC3_9RHOD|nr:50S ribosomal protein L20 [Cyanidiococcus yangmingshanensis]QMX77290.1 50S ribosomal protein L20 [Cyanidiococcus yangmingshanensis]
MKCFLNKKCCYNFQHRRLIKRDISKYNQIILNSLFFINNNVSYNYLKFFSQRNKIILNKKAFSDLFVFEKNFVISLVCLVFLNYLINVKRFEV